ncbi:MAG: histidine kinase [Odoribacter sp.]|nr:histidine kinase [Odoribacter sp.]
MKNYPVKSYKGVVKICWAVIYLTLLFQFIPQTSFVEAVLYPAFVLLCCYPLTTYLSRDLLRKAIRKKWMYIFFLQFVGVSIVSGIIYFIWSFVFYLLEKNGVFTGSDLFMVDKPLYYVPVFLTAGILVNMLICGICFYEENLKFQKQLYESELYALKTQINPHFMFNVLNHIHYYVETKDDLASVLLLKYSDVLRYQLYSIKNETVPLHSEIQFLKDYIEIEKIRWEDKIQVNCKWKIENPNLTISPLLLITPIENAFKHVSRNSEEKGYINIFLEQKREEMYMEVENSAQIMSYANKANSGLGLENLKKRLDLSYYGKYDLSIHKKGSIYQFSLKIFL